MDKNQILKKLKQDKNYVSSIVINNNNSENQKLFNDGINIIISNIENNEKINLKNSVENYISLRIIRDILLKIISEVNFDNENNIENLESLKYIKETMKNYEKNDNSVKNHLSKEEKQNTFFSKEILDYKFINKNNQTISYIESEEEKNINSIFESVKVWEKILNQNKTRENLSQLELIKRFEQNYKTWKTDLENEKLLTNKFNEIKKEYIQATQDKINMRKMKETRIENDLEFHSLITDSINNEDDSIFIMDDKLRNYAFGNFDIFQKLWEQIKDLFNFESIYNTLKEVNLFNDLSETKKELYKKENKNKINDEQIKNLSQKIINNYLNLNKDKNVEDFLFLKYQNNNKEEILEIKNFLNLNNNKKSENYDDDNITDLNSEASIFSSLPPYDSENDNESEHYYETVDPMPRTSFANENIEMKDEKDFNNEQDEISIMLRNAKNNNDFEYIEKNIDFNNLNLKTQSELIKLNSIYQNKIFEINSNKFEFNVQLDTVKANLNSLNERLNNEILKTNQDTKKIERLNREIKEKKESINFYNNLIAKTEQTYKKVIENGNKIFDAYEAKTRENKLKEIEEENNRKKMINQSKVKQLTQELEEQIRKNKENQMREQQKNNNRNER